MTAQKVAVLDLGTNTFNLLLVKITPNAYYIFRNEKIAVKLGKGGINHGLITEDAKNRAFDAIERYRQIISREQVDQVYGYATSAFRDAKNGPEIKAVIEEKTGFPIHIISGDLEAEFIYKGVKTAIDIGGDNSLIMDIGGGSVEFIIANRDRIAWKKSIDIGAQRLLEWYHGIDPIPQDEVDRMFEFFENNLSELATQMDKYKPTCLIGSSGTFDTLSDIYQHNINRFTSGDETELPLTPAGFQQIFNSLLPLDKEARLKIPGMIEMRADMIVVASCLVKYVHDKFAIDQLRVSAHSLKEGMISVIQEEMKKHKSISIFGN